jgi:acyl-coenzyme A thioesterase PaaI-like protein
VTTLLDATSGACVYMKLKKPIPIATLDLRIDYLKPSQPRRELFARAECFKATRNVAFVRATAYHDEGDPIATATGTFMLSTKGKSVQERAGL